jgi:hypothetical protein
MKKLQVFVSSKMSEFQQERAILKHEIEELPLLEPVLAEDWPPQRATPKEVYLGDVNQCYIYVGLFGCIYSEPTRVEYESAGQNPYRELLIYVRSCKGEQDVALKGLIAEMSDTRVIRKYSEPTDLLPLIRADLHAALWRMVDLCLKLGQRHTSNQETRFAVPSALTSVGVPTNPASALEMANAISTGLSKRGAGRTK